MNELLHQRAVARSDAEYEAVGEEFGERACGGDRRGGFALPHVGDRGSMHDLICDAQQMRNDGEGIAAERLGREEGAVAELFDLADERSEVRAVDRIVDQEDSGFSRFMPAS
jgi:hypothetical protein